ncbi:MAG: radical SAM protein [Candidatus Korarchaeota archaeon NZ13-K]|nr:MAG: radical SAM protein [Candidatus Korarchaeota archaeon NZ13-K]
MGFFPKGMFAEISITGRACQLNCPMCAGRWLRGMIGVGSPEELLRVGRALWRRGVRGILISGGFTREGRLPFMPFSQAMMELKRIGFVMSMHTGPLDRREAEVLGRVGIDVADYELILDEGAIRSSKGLRLRPEDYIRGMENLLMESIEVVPHITLGLPGSGEGVSGYADVLRDLGIRRAVILGFIPTEGTELRGEEPPSPEQMRRAAEMISRVSRVSLGCMRAPWLKREYDNALLGIVDRIANPHDSLNLRRVMACCSIPDEMLALFEG